MTDNTALHDVIVIGSGPAGYTAALYTARAQLKPLVFEGTSFGGALMTTTEVENYPGFRSGITGPELMDEMREQALRFGAELQMEDVESVSLAGPVKEVVTAGGEQELLGRGVSSCATSDGFFFKDQDIAVVGGGDSAMEEATFLTRFARSVTLVHRRDEFRASRIMLERARANDKITFLTNTAVLAVEGDTTVTGLRVRDALSGTESTLAVTGVFIAVGHQPNTQLFEGQLEMKGGYLQVKSGLAGEATMTSVPGVFAAGDVADHTYRQAITSAGTGCMAALDADRWLDHQDAQS